MPVRKQTDGLERGLSAMADTMQGYLAGEQVARTRFIEEREYAFNVDSFEESIRQFDQTFNERVRQFDETMDYNEEQADLTRRHQIFLQDDQQDFSHEETALERTSREVHQQKQRALEYHRIKKNVEMQDADRALRWDERRQMSYKVFLGDAKSYDTMPDFLIQGKADVNGVRQTYSPQEIDFQAELMNLAEGRGSDIIDGVDALMANKLLESIGEGADPMLAAQTLYEMGALSNIVTNERKQAGLEQLMLQRSGGDPVAFAAMSPQDKANLQNTVVHELNNMELSENRTQRRRLEYLLEENAVQTGASAYDPKTGSSPFASVAAANGQYFYMTEGQAMPVWSGLGTSAVGAKATSMQFDTADILNQIAQAPDEETAKALYDTNISKLKFARDEMRNMIKEDGGDTRQADAFYNAMAGILEGKPIDTKEFASGRKPLDKGVARRLGTADGATRAGISGPNGLLFPGDEGYDRAAAIKSLQAQSAQGAQAVQQAKRAASQREALESQLQSVELEGARTEAIKRFAEDENFNTSNGATSSEIASFEAWARRQNVDTLGDYRTALKAYFAYRNQEDRSR